MNYARYDFLTHATLASDEHRQVSLGHLQSGVQGMVECLAIANNAVALLYRL